MSAYKGSGVDRERAQSVISKVRTLAKKTHRPGVLSEIGGFSAFYHLDFQKYKDPILVSSTDGVGTKLRIAHMAQKHDTVGIDLVAMCVNDLLTSGAEPLFFLDYYATGKIDSHVAKSVLEGIVEGCLQAGCALVGGETAEMPSFYAESDYDLAGFAVGVVEREKIVDGSSLSIGDVLIGLSASGLHSNGYSLVRKVLFDDRKMKLSEFFPWGKRLDEELLIPTKIYVKAILSLTKQVQIKGMAHITGGGLVENLPRIFPKSCAAVIETSSWKMPPVFEYLKEKGRIDFTEMYRVFNCGVGFIVAVPAEEVQRACDFLRGQGIESFPIGSIVKRDKDPIILRS